MSLCSLVSLPFVLLPLASLVGGAAQTPEEEPGADAHAFTSAARLSTEPGVDHPTEKS